MERFFRLRENGTNVRTEVTAGIVTFMTMAYILFVNPDILADAGVPAGAVMTGTALAAGLMTILMGVLTNYPFALAAGMGLNAALAYGMVLGMGLPWQAAMGIIVVEGAIITLLVLTNVREAVMNSIPLVLKQAIGVGIGLFIATIGLKNAGLIVANEATLVGPGDLRNPGVWVAVFGLILTVFLMHRQVKGAMLIGIVAATVAAIPLEVTQLPEAYVSLPTRESFATFFATFQTNPETGQPYIMQVLQLGMVGLIFSFLITDFFDTMGTVVAVGGKAGHLDEQGRLPRIKQVLFVDSLAALTGGLFGVSSNTTYIESGSGVAEGGRTGLASVVTGVLFLLAIFLAPIAGVVPGEATAPALIVVGFLMLSGIREIDFSDYTNAFPAFITIVATPLTYSISHGIGYGFVAYSLLKVLSGRAREVHWLMYVVSALFIVSFLLG